MLPPNDFPDISKVNGVKNSSPTTDTGKVSDKVKALREAIANGSYQINTKSIAERMVQSGVLKE